MTIKVLPPGPPDGPDDDDSDELSLMIGPMVDRAIECANAVRIIPHRLFCEGLASGMCATEAMLRARPDLETAGAGEIARAVYKAQRDPAVRKYIETILGVGALTAGISYAMILHQIYIESSDERNPVYVRMQGLNSLADRLETNGVAKREGFDVKSEVEESEGGDYGGMSDGHSDHFLDVLSAPTRVPELPEAPEAS